MALRTGRFPTVEAIDPATGVVARRLARRHAESAVQTDSFAVKHGVVEDGEGQFGVFRGLTEATGERDGRTQFLLDLSGEGGEEEQQAHS